MTMNRHEPFEELISASLHGDLTADERRRLDAHLDVCDQCRGTLAAFSEERRMIAGLRHYAPPRDLGARVRAGIEYGNVPWWRKPTAIFTAIGGTLAAVTGALLALALLNGVSNEPPVAQVTPTPSAAVTPGPSQSTTPPAASATPAPTLPAPPAPGETPGPQPTPGPDATPNPLAAATPEPDLYLAMAAPADSEPLTLTVVDLSEEDEVPVEPADVPLGPAIAAELSPDGGWLAMVTEKGLSGENEMRVSRVADAASEDPAATPIPEPEGEVGETVLLGTTTAGSPFLERLAWTPDGSMLAYTLANPETGTDVWVFDRATGEHWQLTATGDAYAGSWVTLPTTDSAPTLWVSRAEGQVTSYLVPALTGDGDPLERIDPADEPLVTAPHVFQPIVSPNGALAIYWDGVMTQSETGEWVFSQQGAPYLAEHRPEEAEHPFPSERQLFSDVRLDRDAFTSAAISWGLDSDSYTVWNAVWTGLPQAASDQASYPDPTRVYFGHASDPWGLTQDQAIDQDDLPDEGSVVDVKVSPTGQHLVITVRLPLPGDLAAPEAQLLLVTANPDGDDVVEPIAAQPEQWFGPAVFDKYVDIPEADSP